jgi:hypothetical protein
VHGSEMKPPFVLPLANVLSRHKIVGANLEAAEVASHLRDATDIFELMLPKRRIHFDAECISGADDLERVVGHFADATEGTWNLSDLSARLHHDAERGFIDFDTDGRSFHWEFEQSGDYVSQELLDHLQAFARTHLPGDFIEVPTPDQCYCAIYLERPAAEDVRALLDAYKQEFSHWL